MDQENRLKHKAVTTFTEDMTRVLEGDQGGIIKKIIHEEEQREKEKTNFSPQSRKNKLYMLSGVTMITVALSIFLYSLLSRPSNTVIIPEKVAPALYTDKSFYLEIDGLTKAGIGSSILNEVAKAELPINGVETIYLTENKRVIDLRRFIEVMELSFVPGDTALVSDTFVLGVVNTEPRTPFILLKMRTMPDIFPALRAWEDKMSVELKEIFKGMPSNLTWNDGIVGNKNARMLSGTEGNEFLMYVFADNHSVVFSQNQKGAGEIMLRLLQSEIRK